MQNYYSAHQLLPQAASNQEIRTRKIQGRKCEQLFTSGGFFGPGRTTNPRGMTMRDLLKACAVTIDVDAYAWETPETKARWGEDRAARKAAMRAATSEEVLAWMNDSGFFPVVSEGVLTAGLPQVPNRVIFTGQGLCLVYWLEDSIGWVDGDNAWTPERMKAAVKSFHEATGLWWWDADAKDIGTRVFPVPGSFHRDTGKQIALLGMGHNEVAPLEGWFNAIAEKYPPADPKAKAKSKAKAHAKAAVTGQPAEGTESWRSVTFDPTKHDHLEVGEKADACPLCGGSGYKRMCEEHITCFSCYTQFKFAFSPVIEFSSFAKDVKPVEAPAPTFNGRLELDANGYAIWPSSTPDRLLIGARTGSGKTYLMAKACKEWDESAINARRTTIAVAPTRALARNLSQRMGIDYGEANSEVSWGTGSVSVCFAGLLAKTQGLSGKNLRNTYIMIDESESTLSQLLGMLHGHKGRETYNQVLYLCAHAGKVMLCDANAGSVTVAFIEEVERVRAQSGLAPSEWAVWTTARHRHSFQYVLPVMKKAKDGTDKTMTSSDAMHKGLIASKLAEGLRLAVYIPGHKQAMALGRTLQSRFPGLKVKVVVGNKSNDNQHDFSEEALTADVLIFNNSMNTGVSYDLRDHYDEVHLVLGQGSITDGIHVEQAVHRIRHPKSKTFVISGGIGAAINDGRITPEHHIKAAEKRVAAASLAFKKLGNPGLDNISLPLDYLASHEAQRLSKFQATILANRFACGLRWVLPWLAARHEFVGVGGVKDKEFVEDVRDNRKEVAIEEAEAVAQAEPLGDAAVARVEAQGADTEAEHDSYRHAKMAGMFGEAFTEATTSEKSKIVLEAAEKQLVKKTRVMAACRLIHLSDESRVKLLRMDAKRAATATTVTLDSVVPAGLVVREALLRLAATPMVDGQLVITKEDALAVCQATRHHYIEAGFKIRDDLSTAPHRQLAHVLSLAGLKLTVRRVGAKGERRREYTLDLRSAERMEKLSVAFMERWTADEDVVEVGAV